MSVLPRGSCAITLLAAFHTCLPWQVVAAQQPAATPLSAAAPTSFTPAANVTATRPTSVIDLALAEGGLLTGQVFDSAGLPSTLSDVALIHQGEVVATAVTDRAGVFRFGGLTGGSYQVATSHNLQLIRAWNLGTAPPSAQQTALIVDDPTVVRGQYGGRSAVGCSDCVGDNCGCSPHAGRAYGGRPVLNWMRTHPGMVMAGVAAAIAVPVAIAASDGDDPPSS